MRYRIKGQHDGDGDRVEILIYDFIGRDWFGDGVDPQELIDELAEVEASTIDLRINSPGGFVFEGLAIANAFMRHPANVVTHVDGLAASIASVIALAGNEIRIAENAFLVVHNAWGFVVGNRNDMVAMAEVLKKLDGSLRGTYERKTGASESTVRDWMDAETWFSAEDALEVGLVDHVDEEAEVKAGAFDFTRYRNVPAAALAWGGGRPVAPGAWDPAALAAAVDEFCTACSSLEPATLTAATGAQIAIFPSAGDTSAPPSAPPAPDPELVALAALSERTLASTLL